MAGYIIFDFLCIIGGLVWPYLFCYFATRTTNRVMTIGNSVYDLDWYEYPANLQKYIILIIARSQKDAHFSGFSMVHCTLVAFGQVRNSQKIWIFGLERILFLFLCRSFKHLADTICSADSSSTDKSIKFIQIQYKMLNTSLYFIQYTRSIWMIEDENGVEESLIPSIRPSEDVKNLFSQTLPSNQL